MGLVLIPGFGSLGGTELIIALVIILLLFGAKRIPELARGLGSGVKEFRAGTREGLEEKKDDEKSDEAKAEEAKAEEAPTAAAGDETRAGDEPPVEAENAQQKRG